MATILDLSGNNAPLSVAQLRVARQEEELVGCYLKLSEGATFTDARHETHYRRAREAGLLVGAYHYAYPTGGDAEAEAEHFCALASKRRYQLRPALDLEVDPGDLGWHLPAWARAWNAVVRRELGVGPIFYSYPYFLRYMTSDRPIGWGLWLASYGSNDGQRHP